MEDLKPDPDVGAPERCMLCFSVDRTLSAVDCGASRALTAALSPERRLRACWECGATLARLQRVKRRSLQALLLLNSAHATAELKCLSQLARSSTIVIDNDNKSPLQTKTSASPFPAVDELMGTGINDEIKIEINEDFEKLPQCAAWVNSVDLNNDITMETKIGTDKSVKKCLSNDKPNSVQKHSYEVSLDNVNCDNSRHHFPYNDIQFSDEKVDCENRKMNEKLKKSYNKEEWDKEKCIIPVKEEKAIKEEDNSHIGVHCSDNPPEPPHLNKENKLENNISKNEQMLKSLSRLSRSSTMIIDFNNHYFGESLPLDTPAPAVDNLIGCQQQERENLTRLTAFVNSIGWRNNEITMETEIEPDKAPKGYFSVDTAEDVFDATDYIISEGHEKASDKTVYGDKYDDKIKRLTECSNKRLEEMAVTTVEEAKVTKEDEDQIRLTVSAFDKPSELSRLIKEGRLEEFICDDEQMQEARRNMKKMFHSNLRCRWCFERFPGKETLRVHSLERHSEVSTMYSCVCDICTLRFTTLGSLAEHRATHYKLYRCVSAAHNGCDFVSASTELAVLHARIPEMRGALVVFECALCGRDYPDKAALTAHIRTHGAGDGCSSDVSMEERTVEAPEPCVNPVAYCKPCGKQYASRRVYRTHRRTGLEDAHREKIKARVVFVCELCGCDYASKAAMAAHLRTHGDAVDRSDGGRTEEPAIDAPEPCVNPVAYCKPCGKQYASRRVYRTHRRTSPKHVCKEVLKALVVFECTLCGRDYRDKAALTAHKRTHAAGYDCSNGVRTEEHNGAPVAQCEPCGKQYASMGAYRSHLRTSLRHVRREDFKYSCDECKERFSSQDKVKRHADIVHRKIYPFKCEICDRPFCDGTNLRKHVLKVHEGIMPVRDERCVVCDKAYDTKHQLALHQLVHTGERPHPCDICGLSFRQAYSLRNHHRRVHLRMQRTRGVWEPRDA